MANYHVVLKGKNAGKLYIFAIYMQQQSEILVIETMACKNLYLLPNPL